VLQSASRVIDKVITKEQYGAFLKLKKIVALIKENEVLIRVGAYKAGMDKELDQALGYKNRIREFLTQDIQDIQDFQTTINKLTEIATT
jgi:flagellum-specific ATP synthase